ncbi:hypothetical protein [Xanthomonas vesicatoria]|uniref:Uncharacterized protein n=2 Tax=Xanthomonas vesicatoria TaxID=56460 RepID=A0AAJ0IWD2_9XANT|nr:hypothetical protein [Xanthomonas vesicatoria]APO97507.1 hypothetical protein BI313_20295 [Xanthomonas vesicatoria]APP77961.1 hypothetical protein BJD12_17375 [Xanthomonas vesicatoria ATCC 35937]EGD08654.1 hypothetical protein XVE_3089 [Xanthomonas vesicatoria ATCC 35937]KHM91665.1 hypothetical protein OR61_18485 [Xanthomonas vesicatoria]KHM97014.1 hypothetical protein OR60_04185 [Xanthomonas vesicatoria]
MFSLSIGLAGCAQPQQGAQAVTPGEALCMFIPNPPDEELPSAGRDESMQQLTLATRCSAVLRRHR